MWVTGITHAEGNFSINHHKSTGKIFASFKVSQKQHSKGILLDLQKYFSCGLVCYDNKKENTYKFTVYKYDDLLTKIIPHFDKYELLSSKYLDYLDWKQAIDLYKDKSRKSNLIKILSIKEGMNKNRSFDDRWHHFKNLLVINPSWLQAFIDGEGSFQFTFTQTTNRGKPYLASYSCLEIAQSSHDIKLLASIKQYFDGGYLKPKYDIWKLEQAKNSISVNRFRIYDTSKVCSLMDKYPLYTRKLLDYLDWKELVQLKSEKAHNTLEGKQKMREIQKRMNSNRPCAVVKLKTVSSDNIFNTKRCYHTKVNIMPDKKVFTFIKVWTLIKRVMFVISLIILGLFCFIGHLFYLTEVGAEVNLTYETISDVVISPVTDSKVNSNLDHNSNLFESSQQTDPETTPIENNKLKTESIGLTVEDENMIRNMKHNTESFIKNRGVAILSDRVEPADMVRIKSLIESINAGDTANITMSETDSVLYEAAIREIRPGNVLQVYTPSSDSSFDVYRYFTVDDNVTEGEYVPLEKTPSLETISTLSEKIERMHEKDLELERINDYRAKSFVKNCFIISSKPEGDGPLPLPSWHVVEPKPDSSEPEKVLQWTKNLAVQRYWTSKFPFLNEHYEQLTLEKKINDWTIGIQITNNVLEPDVDVFDTYTNGNLGLEKLFKEETNMLSTNEDLNIKELFKEETNMLNTNEDLNIDKLFQEDGMLEQNKQ